MRDLVPDLGRLAEIERRTGHPVTVFCREAEDPTCSVRLRSFAPGAGIAEDPVCGSGNGCVGAYLARTSGARTSLAYRAEQGIEIGRPGRASVRVEPDGDGWRVQVGGTAVKVLEGELRLQFWMRARAKPRSRQGVSCVRVGIRARMAVVAAAARSAGAVARRARRGDRRAKPRT